MALSIRNPKAEKLAREVAAESGETITQEITYALEEGLLQHRIAATYPLDAIAEANEKIENGGFHGCVVVDIDQVKPSLRSRFGSFARFQRHKEA